MKKLIHILFGIISHLLITSFVLNPIGLGTIEGTVTDATTNEPIPFANVVVLQAGQQITGSSTDFDGKYKVSALTPGTYDIQVSNVGYSPLEKTKVPVLAGKKSVVDFELQVGIKLDAVLCISHKIPVISRDASQGISVRGEEIRELAGRGVSSIATQAVGVADNDGGIGSIKGTRSGSADTYIDGVKVRGSGSPPKATYEQVRLTTGRVLDQYGAVNGGVVTIQPQTSISSKKKRKTKAEGLAAGYDLYQSQSFKNVFTEPLSTFSIDVDAASYSQIRRSLNMGSLPPVEIVRIEEMINYFKYDYPQPEGDKPFSITTEVTDCPWNLSNKLVHVGLQGRELDLEARPKNNLIFLIDVSGSMGSYDKLPLLKKSLKLLTKELESTDKISIVVYAGAAGVVLHTTAGDKKRKIIGALDHLNAGGSTAGGEGIQLAYSIAEKEFIKKGNNRIILCTDGDFNVGISSDEGLLKLIEKKRESGVFLTILGFGTGNFKDHKMEQLADKGNGNFAYIDNLQEAQKVLVQEFWGTLYTIAKDVKIQVEFNPSNVLAYRLIGYENRRLAVEDFNDDKKDAGELGARHTVTALYEVIPAGSSFSDGKPLVDTLKYQQAIPSLAKGFDDELLSVKLRYKKPDEDVSHLLTQSVKNESKSLEECSTNLRFSAALSQFGMILLDRGLNSGQRVSQIQQVIKVAKKSKGADKDGRRAEFVRLAELALVLE